MSKGIKRIIEIGNRNGKGGNFERSGSLIITYENLDERINVSRERSIKLVGRDVFSIGVGVPVKKLKYEEELKHGDCEVGVIFACSACHI